MALLSPTERASKLSVELSFFEGGSSTPISLVKLMGKGLDERSGSYEKHRVWIHDGRPRTNQFNLDREGFAFMHHSAVITDFYDDKEVVERYYPTMERLLKKVTDASKVIIFDHTRRIDDTDALERLGARPPASIVHNDFTATSAAQRVKNLLPKAEANRRLGKRFASINVWRPLREPVETAPLAICEYCAIDNHDLVVSERHYPDKRVGKIYNLKYNPQQKWYFFPQMTCDEIILLKCYDSLTDGTARWTAHGSFQDPNSQPDAVPRESIEIRSMVFFD